MNSYRVTVGFGGAGRYTYDVDATSIGVAVGRVLRGFDRRDEASIEVKMTGRNIVRERIEKQSHGRARAAT